ncbi:hypothetical protein AKJ09_10360 [Labilithrix luteola]|uniref:Uncharacterized protein n=1 Tax=Labilithrix luteola TaxID=1391654 RepID=A0A0K1QDF0_9BACT|nr:hypothetical protein AKJ09_10360 [Labilithrix luteola]
MHGPFRGKCAPCTRVGRRGAGARNRPARSVQSRNVLVNCRLQPASATVTRIHHARRVFEGGFRCAESKDGRDIADGSPRHLSRAGYRRGVGCPS